MKASQLADGEEIQADLRTHWKALVGPIVVLVIAVAVIIGVAAFGEGTSWGGWALLVVGVLAVIVVWLATVLPVWRWASTHYVFTNRRISHRSGLLTKKGRDIPLYRINDVAMEKGVLDRILGCGTLVISDATEKAGMELYDVPHVEQVQVMLQNLLYGADDGSDDGEFPPMEPPRR